MLQIQPLLSEKERWMALAKREDICFELIEPSMTHGLTKQSSSEEYISAYRDSGLVRSLHGAFIDMNAASGDPEIRRLSRERIRKSCALANKLGVDRIVLHSSAFPFLRDGYLEGWVETCEAFYRDIAREYGLTICVENSFDLDPEPLLRLMRRCDDPNIRICLDIGHAHYSRAGIERWFEDLGQYIACIHLSDNMGQFDDHLPLGEGTVDWAMADKLWSGLGKKDMPITLEVGGCETVERSMAYLRSHSYFGMGE